MIQGITPEQQQLFLQQIMSQYVQQQPQGVAPVTFTPQMMMALMANTQQQVAPVQKVASPDVTQDVEMTNAEKRPKRAAQKVVQMTLSQGKLVRPKEFHEDQQHKETVQKMIIDTRKTVEQKAKKPTSSQLQYILDDKNKILIDQMKLIEASKQTNFKDQIYDKSNDVDEEIVCDVCRNDEYDEPDKDAPVGSDERIGDNIVICDMCNAGVHQKCYARELINPEGLPDGDWFCQRCTHLKKNPEKDPSHYACDLCNDLRGIIIQYHNRTSGRDGWGHITCINWTPDLWFTDQQFHEVEGDFNIQRYGLVCYICRKKKNSGSCIQCDYKGCIQPFHIRCAIKKGLIQDYDAMIEQKENPESEECFVFCDKHLEMGKRDLRLGGKKRLQQGSCILEQKRDEKKLSRKRSQKQQKDVVDDDMEDEDMEEPSDNEEKDESHDGRERSKKKGKKSGMLNSNNHRKANGFKPKVNTQPSYVPQIAQGSPFAALMQNFMGGQMPGFMPQMPNTLPQIGIADDDSSNKKAMKTKKTGKVAPTSQMKQTSAVQQTPSPNMTGQLITPAPEPHFYVDPEFANTIALTNFQRVTRKDVQNAFITFAINNQIVDINTRVYNLDRFEVLKRKFGTTVIQPNQVFLFLKKVLTQLPN